jgi:uncharacterized membrane protein (UPF0127 family)
MRRFLLIPVLFAMLALASCSDSASMEDVNLRPVKLPNGQVIKCEVMFRPEDMQRGMMFRDSLAPSRGMLFLHTQPDKYKYWMYQVKIPLDIIWMNKDRHIVEISPNTPPCPSKSARECPNYGGVERSQIVLELAGGEAAKQGLKVGDVLDF